MDKLKFNHTGEVLGTVDNGKIKLNEAGKNFLNTIIIPVAPITKKNSQQIRVNHYTGKKFIAPSDNFKIYQNKCLEYVWPFRFLNFDGQYPLNIKCLFYMPTRRRVDLTNLLEAIDDVLTHYGVIPDDDAQHVGGHDGSRVLYDKENPRTEIYISPLDGGVCSEVIKSKCDHCKNKNNQKRINPCFSCKFDDSLNDNFEPIKDAAESSKG